jgi:hypothetical protein
VAGHAAGAEPESSGWCFTHEAIRERRLASGLSGLVEVLGSEESVPQRVPDSANLGRPNRANLAPKVGLVNGRALPNTLVRRPQRGR